jgi:hypothetical protein
METGDKKPEGVKCFTCFLPIEEGTSFITLVSKDGIIQIRNSRGEMVSMIFCSSDCMIADANLRYQDRIARGVYRRRTEPIYEAGGRLPARWRESSPELV